MLLFKLFIFATLFTAILSIEKFICENNILNLDCPAFTYIHIYFGDYGRHNSSICPKQGLDRNVNCTSTNATQIIQQRCEGHNFCILPVSNRIFSDPCVGTYKYLQLNYSCESNPRHTTTPPQPKCGSGEIPGCTNTCIVSQESCNSQTVCESKMKCVPGCICQKGYLRESSGKCVKKEKCTLPTSTTNFVCEDNIANLECPLLSSIRISYANYGRQSSKICPKTGEDQYTNCSSTNATQILQNRCDGKFKCSFTVSSELFSDPCNGTYKYLEINYYCQRRFIIPILCGQYEEIGCNNPCFRHCENPEICDEDCSRGCVCKEGYKRDLKTKKCVAEKHCPQPGTECQTHEVYSGCGAGCEPTCENRNPFCIFQCVPGYVCAENYVRDPNTNRCIPSTQCPVTL